jgi:hypothetical protein
LRDFSQRAFEPVMARPQARPLPSFPLALCKTSKNRRRSTAHIPYYHFLMGMQQHYSNIFAAPIFVPNKGSGTTDGTDHTDGK